MRSFQSCYIPTVARQGGPKGHLVRLAPDRPRKVGT